MNITMSIVLAASVLAATGVSAPEKKRYSLEEKQARRAARIAADGGLLDRPINGKVVRIKVETNKISLADVEKEAEMMRRRLSVCVEVGGKDSESKCEIGAYVLLADQGEKVPTLLCAPEENWSTVNVTRLLAGAPDAETLRARIIKELWRGLAYALGAANAVQQPCVMRPITRPAELDMHQVATVSPTPLMSMRFTAQTLGFAKGGQTSYLRACQEGWAPAPTNDIQKAIWDKAHEVPTKPIKIEYNEKRDKGK